MSQPCIGPLARALGLCAALLAGCSPTHDWREVRPPGARVLALFPCKPASETRTVALGDASAPLTMVACRAGGAMFGLAVADVGDPARLADARTVLQEAQAANLGGRLEPVGPVSVPGADPAPAAARYRIDGRLPDGASVRQQLVYFSRGNRVYQAAVLGPVADVAVADTFFEGLRAEP